MLSTVAIEKIQVQESALLSNNKGLLKTSAIKLDSAYCWDEEKAKKKTTKKP